MINAYLAGPDVFRKDAIEHGEKLKEIALRYNIIGHYPFDNEVDADGKDQFQIAMEIGKQNEFMMQFVCMHSKPAIIINMEKFRGPSMDVGTAFETGFFSGVYWFCPNVTIVGYKTESKEAYLYGVLREDRGCRYEDGNFCDSNDMKIEDFGLTENLMIIHAIEKTGGKVFETFEEACEFLQKKRGEK